MKNNYEVLGLTKESSKEELTARYNDLKAKYSEGRFLAGQEGHDNAVKLTELETAWQGIKTDLENQEKVFVGANQFDVVDALIKEGKYPEAQAQLDLCADRSAHYHYMQSIIFYKREWLAESKTQLEMAMGLDPSNAKYKMAYDKMNQINGNGEIPQENIGGTEFSGQGGMPPQSQTCCSSCNTCCMAYCCADCCCSMTTCC